MSLELNVLASSKRGLEALPDFLREILNGFFSYLRGVRVDILRVLTNEFVFRRNAVTAYASNASMLSLGVLIVFELCASTGWATKLDGPLIVTLSHLGAPGGRAHNAAVQRPRDHESRAQQAHNEVARLLRARDSVSRYAATVC